MKINGQKIEGVNVAWAIIPRDPPISIKCIAVLNYDEFNKTVPKPQPPTVVRPGGVESVDLTDEEYQRKLSERNGFEYDWMCIKSMVTTGDGDLVWETVDPTKPETWKNWKIEMESSGFNQNEIGIVMDGIWKANTLSERMIRAARESFFLSHPEEKRT